MRNKKAITAFLALLLAASLLLSSCQTPTEPYLSTKDSESESESESGEQAEEKPYALIPNLQATPVLLASERAVSYYGSDGQTPVSSYVDDLLTGVPQSERESSLKKERLDLPVDVTLSFTVQGKLPAGLSVSKLQLFLSESEDLSNAALYKGNKNKTEITLSDCLPNQIYYYRFVQTMTDGTQVKSPIVKLEIAASPRFISIDGVANARDAGGYQSSLPGSVKLGMIYRGNELDGMGAGKSNVPMWQEHFLLSEEGRTVMTELLGIRCEMDLRGSEYQRTESAIESGISYVHHPIDSYSHAFSSSNYAVYRAAFRDFADPNNYPMYVHCTYGADRTGTIFFMLGALLGMSREDLIKEYELSGFFYESMSREKKGDFRSFLQKFDALPGATTAEKAEGWCRKIGVTGEEIASIRSILLE